MNEKPPRNVLAALLMGKPSPYLENALSAGRLQPAQEFNTVLPPELEPAFQQWKAINAPNDSGYDYDLRGAFLANIQADARGHGPDTFKKPNHPTFSNESRYSMGPTLYGGQWGENSFTPSPANYLYQTREQLEDYFRRVEPGVKLK